MPVKRTKVPCSQRDSVFQQCWLQVFDVAVGFGVDVGGIFMILLPTDILSFPRRIEGNVCDF